MTTLTKPITRKSNSPLSPMFGADRGKRIVITLIPGNGQTGAECVPDLIELRPERTQRAERVAALDVYMWAMKCRVNKGQLEKARERKAKLDAARKTRALDRAVRKASKEGQA